MEKKTKKIKKDNLIAYGWHECGKCKAHYQEYHKCHL